MQVIGNIMHTERYNFDMEIKSKTIVTVYTCIALCKYRKSFHVTNYFVHAN